MKEGWEYKKFEECVVKIPKQKQIKSKDYLPFGIYPVVSQEQELISGYYNDISYVYKHSKPIVVFGDHTKNIKFIDFDFVVGADGTHILKTIDKIETKFFYYTLKSIKLENLGYARHFKLLKREVIGFPSLDQQRRIVSYLDSSFQLIDKIKEKAQKSLSESKTLFQSALAEAMEPKEGWEEKTLKEIGLTQTGTTPSKANKEYYGDYIPFIRPSEINIDGIGTIEYNSEIKLSKKGIEVGRKFTKNSILMVCIGATIGKVGYSGRDVSCNQQINVLSPYNGYNYKYIYYAMSSSEFQKKVITEGTSAQATLPIINKGKWERLPLHIPPLSTQHQIVSHLDKLSSNVKQMEEKYQKIVEECDTLKQAMLRDVFE